MVTEDELAFLKVHLAELSPTVLKQLKWDILAEKRRREAEATARDKGSAQWAQNRLFRGGHFCCPQGPPSHSGQAKGQRIDHD
jgi:hypothetical protein